MHLFFSSNLKSIFSYLLSHVHKIGLIVGIVVLGGLIFSSEITTLFPNSSTVVVNSLKDDVSNLSSKMTNSAEKRISESFDSVVDKTNDTMNQEITKAEDTITNKLSNFNPVESIQNFFTDKNE